MEYKASNLEGLLLMPLLAPEEIEKEHLAKLALASQ
jgi:hypothetical protein